MLAGGQNLTEAFADMWIWDGLVWKQLDAVVPGKRGFHAMEYDPDSKTILLFGGRDGDELLNDIWGWDGNRWNQLSPDGPVRRGIYAAAYDRQTGEFLFHGSGDRVDGTWVLNSRTWAWSARSGWRVASIGD